MTPIDAFLSELDRSWDGDDRVTLRVIGSVALMLQAPYVRATKDYDVLEVSELGPETRDRLQLLGGKGTKLAERHQVYLDVVPAGLPFLPRPPLFHPLPEASAKLQHFSIEVLCVADVCVSKLKRFSASDQGDIEAMANLGVLDSEDVLDRFRNAIDANSMSAVAEDYPKILERFQAVQRDWLCVDETEIDLPDWS